MIIWTQSSPVATDRAGAAEPAVDHAAGSVADHFVRLATRAAEDRRLGVLLATAPTTALAFQPLSMAAVEALSSRDPQRLRRLGAPEGLIALVVFPRVHGVLFPN